MTKAISLMQKEGYYFANYLTKPKQNMMQYLLQVGPTARQRHAEDALRWFLCQAWPILEPTTPFIDNWHIDCIAEHLEAVAAGQIRRLLINQPPRSLKSTLVSICWPVWCWSARPELRFMFASYSQSLAAFHSVQRRLLLRSDWYRRAWPQVRLTRDQNQKHEFSNTRQGMMIATSVGGTAIGKGGDILVFDDPLSPTEAASAAMRQTTNDWIRQGFLTRLNHPSTGCVVGVMQRLHAEDTAGMPLAMGDWHHLCLPAEAEERQVISFPMSGKQLIREPGDLLFPAREGREELARKKRQLGSYAYAGQYQQRPAPAEGGLLKRCWWRFWYPTPQWHGRPGHEEILSTADNRNANYQENGSFTGGTPVPPGTVPPPVTVRLDDGALYVCPQVALPEYFPYILQSWDMAFKETEASDFVVGQVWGNCQADKFLLEQLRGRMDFPKTLASVRALAERYPQAYAILIEDKANGAAVVSTLQREISGIIAVSPEGGKEARVHAVAAGIEAGNVYLPHPACFPWVQELIEECAAFPNATHDDQVDALSQALLRYIQHPYQPVYVSVGPPRAELLAYKPR